MELTRPGEGYESPKLSEIERAARFYGLPRYHPQLMRDIANLISGGEILEPPEEIGEEGAKYIESITGVLQHPSIKNPNLIPGLTPLTKAINFIYSTPDPELIEAAGGGVGDGPGGQAPQPGMGGEGEQAPGVESGAPEGSDPNFDNAEEYAAIQDLIEANEIIKRINKLLQRTPSFELSKRKKMIPDAFGTTLRTRGIEEISEIPKLRQVELGGLKTTFGRLRIVTGEAQIKEWCKEAVPKKRYYLLVDASVSMKQEDQIKISKAMGVLYTLMQRVLKLDVVVDLSFFSGGLSPFVEVSDVDTVKQAIQLAHSCKFDGGATNIENALSLVFDDMAQRKKKVAKHELEIKDIVIITDGQDSNTSHMNAGIFKMNNARLHYIEINQGAVGMTHAIYNPVLQRIALETGGFSAVY